MYYSVTAGELGATGAMKRPNDKKPGARTAQPGKPSGKGDWAFDLWLKNSLHDMYDGISKEPLPEELVRMILEDREK